MANFKAVVLLFTALVATEAQFSSNHNRIGGFPSSRPGFPSSRPGFPSSKPGFPSSRSGFPSSKPFGFSPPGPPKHGFTKHHSHQGHHGPKGHSYVHVEKYHPHPVDCLWSDWYVGPCDRPCGGGYKKLTRTIYRAAKYGGKECYGPHSKAVPCNTHPCPVDCIWGEFTFGNCSAPCGEGIRIGERPVLQPALYGGRPCEGSNTTTKSCNSDPEGGAQFFDFTEETLDTEDIEESGSSLISRVCSEDGAVEGSCRRINIDFDTFDREESLKIFCTTCKQKFEKKFEERETKFYEGDDLASIVLTRNTDLGYPSLHGTFNMPGNGTFSIENCGEDCHVFVEHTQDKVTHPEYDESGVLDDDQLDQETMAMIEKGREDETTNATISVIFYYTDLFEEETPDIKGHIDNIIETTNFAYMNSKMPQQLEFHCMLKVPYPEIPQQNSKERLQQFKDVQRNNEEDLLQSADLAILLTSTNADGGIGGEVDGVDPTRNPGKFAAAYVSKNYKKAFIHEIGHLFGARHDRRQDSRRFADAYEHGFFLRDANNRTRDADQSDSQFSTFNYTIMAAGDAQDDGDGRILYFSTPIDTGRGRGVFGTDRDDNRRKHIETRFAVANKGDESIPPSQCGYPKDTSILLYPTYLVTRFIPAFFS